MSFRLRRDLADIIHYEMKVPGRSDPSMWTPMCAPNVDWWGLTGDVVEDGVPTCVWCIAERRRQ